MLQVKMFLFFVFFSSLFYRLGNRICIRRGGRVDILTLHHLLRQYVKRSPFPHGGFMPFSWICMVGAI